MKEYTRIIDFNYKGKKYALFIDNKDKYYFLSINNGKYEYIDIDTFLELGRLFSNSSRTVCAKNNRKIAIIPKILIGSTIITLSASSILTGCKFNANQTFNNGKENQSYSQEIVDYKKSSNNSEIEIEIPTQDENKYSLNINAEDNLDDRIEIDTYNYYKVLKSLKIYDSDYLYLYLDFDNVTLDDLYAIIDGNNNIDAEFKSYIKEYCYNFINKQPNAERRILLENLKTLKIVKCDDLTLAITTMSNDSLACYVRDENTIYVKEDYEFRSDKWNYQILYHELTHVARAIWTEKDGITIRIQPDGGNFSTITCEEALNSIFAVSLFDYEEKDIAYQLQSNIIKMFVDNMDNYEISDYMNHSLSYFARALDEYHGDNNYARIILELIEAQFNVYHHLEPEVDQSEFYPLYKYISDIYYKSRINENTTYEEALNYTKELLEIILYDVPYEYKIDTDYFYQYLEEYCSNLGITKEAKLIK